MHFISMILKNHDDKCATTIGFKPMDYQALKSRLTWWHTKGIQISTEINRYIAPKTDDQLGLFHVLCRKIAKATKTREELIKQALKDLYGAEELNPFYRVEEDDERDKYVTKSIASYSKEELTELIEGTFAEGEYLRLQGGYHELDLWNEYQQYIHMKVADGKA